MKRRDPAKPYKPGEPRDLLELLSSDARDRLDGWPTKARSLFVELLEDAATDLQRELLNRAVAANHSPGEVHAFADALRGLSDDEAFEACTLGDGAGDGYTVVQMLRAESDPLYAYEVKGGELSPSEADEPSGPSLAYLPPGSRKRPDFEAQDSGARQRRSRPFESNVEASDRHRKVDVNDLGASRDARPVVSTGSAPAVPPPSQGALLMQDLLNDSGRALGVSYREQAIDGDAPLTLEQALEQAAACLGRGVPVPICIGPEPGKNRRFALLLQMTLSGKARAWQLYDPFSQELCWANEGDLLRRVELPFANKLNRRITRIALPTLTSAMRF